jgi:HSP90 family molecular chaperone
MFIKEGSIDPDFKKDVIDLNRYEITGTDGLKTLKDYVKLKKSTQDRIFFFFSPSKVVAQDSPYIYPLTKAGIPVLIATTHIDEFVFR